MNRGILAAVDVIMSDVVSLMWLIFFHRVKSERGLDDLLVMYNKPPRWNEEVSLTQETPGLTFFILLNMVCA